MADASAGSKRMHRDMMKLMMSDYEVHIPNEQSVHEFFVKFHGPAETPYEGGVWKVHVMLPRDYPFKSPSIGFKNRIYHPNVDDLSGSVCLDVINQTWSPMFSTLPCPLGGEGRASHALTTPTGPCLVVWAPHHVLEFSPN